MRGHIYCKLIISSSCPIDNFRKLCSIRIDAPSLPPTLERSIGNGGYYRVNFDAILQFNSTELKAQVAWEENGEENRLVIVSTPGWSGESES